MHVTMFSAFDDGVYSRIYIGVRWDTDKYILIDIYVEELLCFFVIIWLLSGYSIKIISHHSFSMRYLPIWVYCIYSYMNTNTTSLRNVLFRNVVVREHSQVYLIKSVYQSRRNMVIRIKLYIYMAQAIQKAWFSVAAKQYLNLLISIWEKAI